MNNWLAVVALLLAALALALAIVGPRGARPGPGTATEQPSFDAVARFDALSERLDALDRTVGDLLLQPVPSVRSAAVVPAEPARETDAELEQRVNEVEQWIAGEEEQRRVSRERRAARQTEERDADSVEEWTTEVLGGRTTPEETLVALRSLRGRRLADGSDARVPILHDVIRLAQTSPHGELREDVWRQLDGVTEPILLAALLDALAHDAHAGAREEAAESLAPFLPGTTVESALRLAAEHDPDSGVRKQASDSLSGRRK